MLLVYCRLILLRYCNLSQQCAGKSTYIRNRVRQRNYQRGLVFVVFYLDINSAKVTSTFIESTLSFFFKEQAKTKRKKNTYPFHIFIFQEEKVFIIAMLIPKIQIVGKPITVGNLKRNLWNEKDENLLNGWVVKQIVFAHI